jgi:hypothetical protein
MEALLTGAGLQAFEAPLAALGGTSADALRGLSNDQLLSPVVGMRMLHVNKLRRVLTEAAAGGGGAGVAAPAPVEAAVAPVAAAAADVALDGPVIPAVKVGENEDIYIFIHLRMRVRQICLRGHAGPGSPIAPTLKT